MSALLALVAALAPQAAPPSLLHLQARIADAAGVPIAGPVLLETRIYAAAAAANPLWSETQTVTALDGVVNVLLGSTTPFSSGLFDGDRWLALRVATDPEMTPRLRIASVPFARRAAAVASLDGATAIPAGLIQEAHLAPGCVDGTKIVDGSVKSADLGDAEITKPKIAVGAVDGSRIQDGSVAAVDLTSPLAAAGWPSPVLDAAASGGNGVALRGTSSGAASSGVFGGSSSTSGRGVTALADAASGATFGVHATSASTSGKGVFGEASAATGTSFGVYGLCGSSDGTGVFGTAPSAAGITSGVRGEAASPFGRGVVGTALSAFGTATGVVAESAADHGRGVSGTASAATSFHTDGVYGETASTGGDGVHGAAVAPTGPAYGVYGTSASTSGRGVSGHATAASGTTYGVRGQTSSATGYGVYSSGSFGGTGAKYFLQPHPADPSRAIRFVCLEGNEAGTYFRGSSRIEGGRSEIAVPEEFRLASAPEGLTVVATPVGAPAVLWVESKGLDRIVVRGAIDVEFDYVVNGLRRGFESHEAIVLNESFVPEVAGVPFGTQYPEGLRRILVENGTLREDFTPNEETARRIGWRLRAADDGARGR